MRSKQILALLELTVMGKKMTINQNNEQKIQKCYNPSEIKATRSPRAGRVSIRLKLNSTDKQQLTGQRERRRVFRTEGIVCVKALWQEEIDFKHLKKGMEFLGLEHRLPGKSCTEVKPQGRCRPS